MNFKVEKKDILVPVHWWWLLTRLKSRAATGILIIRISVSVSSIRIFFPHVADTIL